MAHFSVTVVIPMQNQWDLAKVCLETLRPTLGLRDEVIVVLTGPDEFTTAALRHYPWVKVLSNDVQVTNGEARNQGATAASGNVVVFLEPNAVLANRWIDGVTSAFADEDVVAAAPRVNGAGRQGAGQPSYDADRVSEFRKFARAWRETHRGVTTQVDVLDDTCIAVRTAAFHAIGGFDDAPGPIRSESLSRRLTGDGGKLVIAEESFVHFQATDGAGRMGITSRFTGTAPRRDDESPLLSACMIIKNEADNLSRCLTSLNGLVDEVVIYDTGSTDGSIEMARAAGATVIEGYWDNDFGRARNAALEACRGEWVLHIDADETFEGDRASLRQFIQVVDQSALLVDTLNLSEGNTHNLVHRPCRLFKRELYHWTGRLHEQVTRREGDMTRSVGVAKHIRLKHYGYLAEAMEAKGKVERNLEIARLDVENDDGRDEMDKLTNLARSMIMAGKTEEAQDVFDRARQLTTDSLIIRRMLLRSAAQGALALARVDEALSWIDELDTVTTHKDTVRYLRGMAYSVNGDFERCLAELADLHEMQDDDGMIMPMYLVRVHRGTALAALDRWEEAADDFAAVATDEAHDEPIWHLVVNAFWKTGRDMARLFATMPLKHLNAVFGQLTNAHPDAADQALEALWTFEDRHTSILALAIRVAPKLSVERALEWSARLRAVGLDDQCPLMSVAFDTSRPAIERLRATAVAHEAFADPRAAGSIKLTAPALPEAEFAVAVAEVNDIAPSLIETLILSIAAKPHRALAMGRVLYELGADQEGIAVVLHGVEQGANGDIAEAAAAWLESVGLTEEAAAVRSTAG